uniref:HAUS augmin like complex subunit 8 n=1 Tax=Chelydra serpentina TaxID=8475 RepID=A0A8C3RZL6_CHESE
MCPPRGHVGPFWGWCAAGVGKEPALAVDIPGTAGGKCCPLGALSRAPDPSPRAKPPPRVCTLAPGSALPPPPHTHTHTHTLSLSLSVNSSAPAQTRGGDGMDDLQSTLLEGHKIARPDLDLSAINGKLSPLTLLLTSLFKSEISMYKSSDPDDVIGMLESQALLLNYASMKIEKNIAQLEEKGERNLSILCEEKEKQQKKLYELKRQLSIKKREQKLEEVLDKQIEVLAPLLTVCEQFKEEYKTFATALDTTRHELPMKNIHMEGNRQKYLEDLQKHLAVTQSLLVEAVPGYLEENSKAFPVLKELKEVALKMDAELERSFKQVQDLSFEISKEVSLHNQKVCEETHGMETLKHWYFDYRARDLFPREMWTQLTFCQYVDAGPNVCETVHY